MSDIEKGLVEVVRELQKDRKIDPFIVKADYTAFTSYVCLVVDNNPTIKHIPAYKRKVLVLLWNSLAGGEMPQGFHAHVRALRNTYSWPWANRYQQIKANRGKIEPIKADTFTTCIAPPFRIERWVSSNKLKAFEVDVPATGLNVAQEKFLRQLKTELDGNLSYDASGGGAALGPTAVEREESGVGNSQDYVVIAASTNDIGPADRFGFNSDAQHLSPLGRERASERLRQFANTDGLAETYNASEASSFRYKPENALGQVPGTPTGRLIHTPLRKPLNFSDLVNLDYAEHEALEIARQRQLLNSKAANWYDLLYGAPHLAIKQYKAQFLTYPTGTKDIAADIQSYTTSLRATLASPPGGWCIDESHVSTDVYGQKTVHKGNRGSVTGHITAHFPNFLYPTEGTIMSNKAFQTINYVYGRDITTLTIQELLASIKQAKKEKMNLLDADVKSKTIDGMVAELDAAIGKMTEALDAKS